MFSLYKNKDIDFYAAFTKKTESEKEKLKKNILIAIPIVLVSALGIAFLVMSLKISSIYKELDIVKGYTTDPVIIAEFEDSKKLAQVAEGLNEEIDELTEINGILGSYPVFNTDKLNRIYGALPSTARITQLSYEAATGVVNIDLTVSAETYAPIFVKQLRNTKIFRDISYYGYNGGDAGYSFRVVGVLKGGNER